MSQQGLNGWRLRRIGDKNGKPMAVDLRKVAVATAGSCTFLKLYSPQALLPALSREFGVAPPRSARS
jgi:hypothetical protein